MEVPERIEVRDGTRVVLGWEDGTSAEIPADVLRSSCPCAECREPEGVAATRRVLAGPDPVTITNASLVGGYAVSFEFAPDGHGTGIYPFDVLAALGTS